MKKLGCEIYLFLTALLMFVACTEGSDSIPETSEYSICWNVHLEQGQRTRALVNDELLLSSCTDKVDNTNESIGLWGQHEVENRIVRDFIDVPLTYGAEAWNYSGELRRWRPGAVYDFRAYYPQRLMTELMTEKSATLFQGVVNTSEKQEDVLVTALRVDTRTANLNDPVPLNMQHVFAAVMFKVKGAEGFTPPDGEGITSCWLQNTTGATDLFSTSGTLKHSGNASQQISWEKGGSTAEPMYLWEHEGLSFNTENALYASNNGGEGNKYTNNDGWLLVIPQQVKAETLTFCYTLKSTGSQVFSVNIPAVTYESGQLYTYLLEISGSDVKLSLGIQPWNKKNISYNIGVTEFKEKPKFKWSNGPVTDYNNLKEGSCYLIYNTQSKKYLYAHPAKMRVETGSSYGTNDRIDPLYVWKLDNNWNNYYWIESMGLSGYFMQSTQGTDDVIPLTNNRVNNDFFTIRTDNSSLRLRFTSDQLRFLAVDGNGNVFGHRTTGVNSMHYFYFYEVIEQ